jgi:hypothetical protein
MNITLSLAYVKQFSKENPKYEELNEYLTTRFFYSRSSDTCEIDISFFEDDQLVKFREFLLEKLKSDTMVNGSLQRISAYIQIRKDSDTYVPTNLRDLEPALKAYIAKHSRRRWLFKLEKDNVKVPYLVVGIKYEPAEVKSGYTTPASTSVSMKYMRMDDVGSVTMTFYDHHLRTDKTSKKLAKKQVSDLLAEFGYMVGIDQICEEYDKEVSIFLDYRDRIGEQFLSDGSGHDFDRYSSKEQSLNTDGVYHKLVVDEPSSRKVTADQFVGAGFWEKDNNAVFMVPVHPYIRMFNLKTHDSTSVHVSTLKVYVYDKELIHKLVLDAEVKELIEILGTGTRLGYGDIIKGKAEGIIVGCIGKPGLGKTLSAEIYSEFLGRPLYTVQCAQLGINPDQLEKRLVDVLNRASRWRAVLLLDEADVYVRERGDDLVQNAVVGVFLRVLEGYTGVLFMTSNLTNIDDAIKSRFTAKITYKSPTVAQSKEIWSIQMVNHGWEVDTKLIDKLVTVLPNLVGRDIRSVLKLSTLLCKFRNKQIDYQIIMHAAKFSTFDNSPIEERQEQKQLT